MPQTQIYAHNYHNALSALFDKMTEGAITEGQYGNFALSLLDDVLNTPDADFIAVHYSGAAYEAMEYYDSEGTPQRPLHEVERDHRREIGIFTSHGYYAKAEAMEHIWEDYIEMLRADTSWAMAG